MSTCQLLTNFQVIHSGAIAGRATCSQATLKARCRLRVFACALSMLFVVSAGCSQPASTASTAAEPRRPVIASESDAKTADAAFALSLDGAKVDPLADPKSKATVLLFVQTECPISNRYAPEFRRICEEYAPRGVKFYLVYPDPTEDAKKIRKHIKEYEYPCDALRDPEHDLVRLTEASRTPEAAVFNPDKKLVYLGRINDWNVDYNKRRAKPLTHDLRDALTATLDGKPVPTPKTQAVGCYISNLK